MKHKILLTSLVAMFAVGSAFADTYVTGTGDECVESVLGTSTGPAELTADWAPLAYDIAFNANSARATGSTAGLTGVHFDTTTWDNPPQGMSLTSNGFTNVGYDFSGWCKGAANASNVSCGTPIANGATVPNSILMADANNAEADGSTINLYAQWTAQTISCDPGTYYAAATATCETCPAGYACAGTPSGDTWTYNEQDQGKEGCTGTSYSTGGAASCSTCPTGSTVTTVNGVNTACSVNQISLTWKIGNETATGGSATCTYGSGIDTLPSNPTAAQTPVGYKFKGWKVTTETDTQTEP